MTSRMSPPAAVFVVLLLVLTPSAFAFGRSTLGEGPQPRISLPGPGTHLSEPRTSGATRSSADPHTLTEGGAERPDLGRSSLDRANLIVPAYGNVSSIPVGINPTRADYDIGNGFVYVTNYGSNNVSVINGTTVIGSVNIGSDPNHPAYDDLNGYYYTANSGSNNVSVISGTRLVTSIPVGENPSFATYDPGNGYVYVANQNTRNVSIISGTTVVRTLSVKLPPAAATFDGENGYVYISEPNSPTSPGTNLSVIDGTSLIGSIAVGKNPLYAAYDPMDGFLYVPNYGSDNVSVIYGTTVIASVDVGSEPYNATFDGRNGLVYITNYGSSNVSVINGTKLAGTVSVGADPFWATYDSGNGEVYVSSQGVNTVAVIDGTHSAGELSLGGWADYGAYDSGNGYLYLPDYAHDNVSVVRTGYTLSFSEAGLPRGASWSVIVNGTRVTSNSTSLSLPKPNGTYEYRVGLVSGYIPIQANGSVAVVGANASVSVTFRPAVFPITFNETGLPFGTNWSITLGNVTRTLPTASIEFTEPNGTYQFLVGTVPGWTTADRSGSLTENGTARTEFIEWTPTTYPVNFTETGLPVGTEWWINITGGPSTSSVTVGLVIDEPNGTYPFSVATANKSYSSPTGSVTVDANASSDDIVFSEVTYTVSFLPLGLPIGTRWSVTFDGVSESGMGNLAFAGIPNGTYAFSVPPVAGYSTNRSNGFVEVSGPPASQSIAFKPSSSSGGSGAQMFLGLPDVEGYGLVGGIIAAVLVITLAGVLFRRRAGGKPSGPVEGTSYPGRGKPPT